jgi:hypothetical protein
MHAAMGFGDAARPLKDQGLGDMEAGQIGGAAGVIAEFDPQYRARG